METTTLSRRRFLTLTGTSLAVGAAASSRSAAQVIGEPVDWSGPPQHFVLVHGAWHGAWCWYKTIAALTRHGQQVTAIDLPGAGTDPTPLRLATRQLQVERVTTLLDGLSEPVILVGHSAGGPIISAVADARPDKVAKLVYLTAYLLPNGVSLAETSTTDADSLLSDHLVSGPEEGTIDVEEPVRRPAFYNRCNNRDVALAGTLFKPISAQPLLARLRIGSNFELVRRFYISCLDDHAISPGLQETMYTALPCEKVISLDSDHSPFFSHPRKLLRALADIAGA